MKRFAVFTVMLVASMLLTSCLSFSQATVNPGATSTSTSVPVTGGLEQGTSVTGNNQGLGTSVTDNNQVPGASGTVVGTYVPFVPNTGEFTMEGTPQPLGTSVYSNDGQVFPYASSPFPGLGTSAAGTPEVTNNNGLSTSQPGAAVPNTGASDALVRLTQLMSYSFSDTAGTNLGQVTDFVLNIPQARIAYVVVNTNGRTVLVPWASVSFSGQVFDFSGTTDQLNNAPLFDQNTTNFNDQNWDQNYQQFWGSGSVSGTQTPDGSNSQGTGTGSNTGVGTQAILASQLLRIQVVAPGFTGQAQPGGTAVPNTGTSQSLGQVQDALVSQSSGSVPWLLISVSNNFINLNNRVIPIPFPAIGNLDVNGLFLTLNQSMLSNAPTLDSNNLPNLFGSGWDQQFFQFWNNSGLNNLLPTSQP